MGIFDKAKDLAGDAVDAVGDVAGKAGDAVGDAAGKAWDVAGDAAEATGDLAGKAGGACRQRKRLAQAFGQRLELLVGEHAFKATAHLVVKEQLLL